VANIHQQSKYADLPWVDLVILAAAEKDEFSDVRFITLKSYYQDVAFQQVIDNMSCDSTIESRFFACVEKKAEPLMNSGNIQVKEFVEIDNDLNVTMCLNVDTITDDAMTEALNILADINVEPNTFIEFGSDVTFHATEMPTLSYR